VILVPLVKPAKQVKPVLQVLEAQLAHKAAQALPD
jgi:hypothetical protein